MAIFREPYLSFIMEGKKKVETRFAKRACPPFGRVADGDVVLLKKAGGAIIGICEVEKVWFYHLDPKSFASIKERFGELICPENASFWIERKTKAVATLMLVKNVFPVKGLTIEKRDRRGWVVFEEENQMCLFQE
jgi:ASC-1-like (ASCH) protein